eukprot:m.476531 g.476531  ORF g.476531 m.476531 type:complete len:164 (+) comp20554_c0_seq1:246-737(+)
MHAPAAAVAAVATAVVLVAVVSTQASPVRVGDNPNTLLMRVQKCDSSDPWTLHGLWPNWGFYCNKTKFDINKISDLQTTMEHEWMSCPGHHDSNAAFWAHEWEKHGVCTGLDEHGFFQTALHLYEQYGQDGPNICFDRSYNRVDDSQCGEAIAKADALPQAIA